MNKRIKKKKLVKRSLTPEQELVLKLYDNCEGVSFYRYEEPDLAEAALYVGLVGKPEMKERGTAKWAFSENGKISATAFLK